MKKVHAIKFEVKEYYYWKAEGAALKLDYFCFILQSIDGDRESEIPSRDFGCIGPYIVVTE